MKYLLLITIVLFSSSFFCTAQVEDSTTKKPALVLLGGADAYYRYNINAPRNAPYNSLTSFTRSSNSFELGMATIRADHSFGKVSATVDLGFGTRAEEFAYNDANTRLALKQLYVSYAPSSVIKFTLGSWATHVGYELVDPWLNRNYSMSYMFTNGPFTHTGLKADISLGGKNAIMLGVSNPVDYRSSPSLPKSLIAQFATGTNDDKLKAYFNFVGGKQNDFKKLVQGDVVVLYTVTDQFSLGLNATVQSVKTDTDSTGDFTGSKWLGAAVYLNYDPAKWLGLTLRTEYISDKDEYLGFKNIFAPTLSANFKIDNLTIIPEFRFDHAGRNIFYKTTTENVSYTSSFILAVAYHF